MFRAFIHDCRGATAIEYVMIAFLVSIVAIAAYTLVSDNLADGYYSDMSSMPL